MLSWQRASARRTSAFAGCHAGELLAHAFGGLVRGERRGPVAGREQRVAEPVAREREQDEVVVVLGVLRGEALGDRERAPESARRRGLALAREQVIADGDVAERDAREHAGERVAKDELGVIRIVEGATVARVNDALGERARRDLTSARAQRDHDRAFFALHPEGLVERRADRGAFGESLGAEEHDDDIGRRELQALVRLVRLVRFVRGGRGPAHEAALHERREAYAELLSERPITGRRGNEQLDRVMHHSMGPS